MPATTENNYSNTYGDIQENEIHEGEKNINNQTFIHSYLTNLFHNIDHQIPSYTQELSDFSKEYQQETQQLLDQSIQQQEPDIGQSNHLWKIYMSNIPSHKSYENSIKDFAYWQN